MMMIMLYFSHDFSSLTHIFVLCQTKAKPKRGTSLAETSSHVSTMRMLEQKLRGVPSSSTSRTTETAPHIQKSSEYTDTEDNLYEKTIEAGQWRNILLLNNIGVVYRV